MLDDIKYIHDRDAQDALGIAEKQAQQYDYNYDFQATFSEPINEIVIAGMGGSGLAAKALKTWPGHVVPLTVIQDYDLPNHVGINTLLICSSYSGNTEETLSVTNAAINMPTDARPMMVIVASGGQLLDIAKEQNVPYITLPANYQPRMTFGYQLRALIEILEQTKLLSGAIQDLQTAADWLSTQLEGWLPVVAVKNNYAKQLALELMGKSVVMYAGPKLSPAAYKWKISFNENAKNIAWYNQYPEFNHNEFLGWTSHPTKKPYAIIELRSNLEHSQVQKRFEVSNKLLSGQRPSPEVVTVLGTDILEQLMWAIALGDFVSLYLALLNGLNPTPVDLIEKFKLALQD